MLPTRVGRSDRPVADLPAILLAQACPMPCRAMGMSLLAAGVPLTLLVDLAAGDDLDSAEILAVEQATAMAVTERAHGAQERAIPKWGKGNSDIA